MTSSLHQSCGGIVFRTNPKLHQVEILLLIRRPSPTWSHYSWHLPKGTMEPGESEEATAWREIREETGYDVHIQNKVGYLSSTFQRDGQTISKRTCYFACRPQKRISAHIEEHDALSWVPFAQAVRLLRDGAPFEAEDRILNQWRRLVFSDLDLSRGSTTVRTCHPPPPPRPGRSNRL